MSTFVVLVEHGVTLIILFLWFRTTHKHVDVSHPLYALLYQEIIVLALLASLNIIFLLVIMSGEGTKMTMVSGIYLFTYMAALQFHQVTCLLATCLRCNKDIGTKSYTPSCIICSQVLSFVCCQTTGGSGHVKNYED